jgi:hypothetical protein
MMGPLATVGQVFDAIQSVKSRAPEFCTNFFPPQRKMQGWIDHGELLGEVRNRAAFFLRKDRDFWHLYFCAANHESLAREITGLPELKNEPVAVDLIGNEVVSNDLSNLLQSEGFRPYRTLYRMARIRQSDSPASGAGSASVDYAMSSDAPVIWELLGRTFDRYAEQLPALYEIETAIDHHQILTAKHNGALAGLLFFETQGLTSTVRYWLVDEPFRAFRFGSALMQRYFAAQSAVRRFVLWVLSDNESALQKYRHYGYAADGLVDRVLLNRIIQA